MTAILRLLYSCGKDQSDAANKLKEEVVIDGTIRPCKGIPIPECGKVLLVEFRIRETFAFGIRNSAQGIENPTND